MSIKISGLASGLPANLVDQVIEAERMPIKTMQADKTKIEDKIKLVTDLETKVNDINKNLGTIVGAKGFVDRKLNSSFPDIVSGVLDAEKAEAGEWNLEVLQLAGKPSVVTNGFPDKDKTTMGVGYLKFDTADGEKEVYINEDNSTLDKIAETINNTNVGVRAVVINDRKDKEDNFKLQITGMKPGNDNEIKFPTVYLLDGEHDLQFESQTKSNNAKFKLDGHEYETDSNLLKDLIPGITLDLKRAAVNQPVRIQVTENQEAISGKVKSFVDAFNATLSFIQGQNKLSNDAKGNPHLGPLGGDSMLRMTESRLRSIIQDSQNTDSKFKRVIELGIEFNRNGTLTFNEEKFSKIVNTNPEEVAKFLRGNFVSEGFIPSMKRNLGMIVDPSTGPVTSRKKNYQDRIKKMDERIERKEKSLTKREETLRNQFAKMEETMSKLQSQGAAVQGSIGGR
ncbi:MAG: flagellar filament capping protein FliD [Pseudobdellovibrio sp.]